MEAVVSWRQDVSALISVRHLIVANVQADDCGVVSKPADGVGAVGGPCSHA